MNSCRFYLVIILFLISVINLFSQNGWNGKIEDYNGIPLIVNSDKPIYVNPTIKLNKQWEVGGEYPGFIFNNITAIDVDDSSRVYVTDVLEKNVKVFSSSGVLLFTFGRQGQGPGEFQSPRCLTILPNNLVLVIDIGGGSIIPFFKFFSIKGDYIEGYRDNLVKNEFGSNHKIIDRTEILAMPRIYYSQLFNDNSLILYTENRINLKYKANSLWMYDFKAHYAKRIIHRKRIYPEFSGKKSLNDKMFINTQWCNDKNGNIYFIDDIYNYKIDVYDSNGNKLRTISRDFEFPQKSDDEYDKDRKEAEKYTERKRRIGKKITYNALKYHSIIFNLYPCSRSMFCDDKNQLWVLTNESFSKAKTSKNKYRFSFDVFDYNGQYLQKLPFDANEPRCFVYKNGFLHFVDYKEDGFPWLIKYQIE